MSLVLDGNTGASKVSATSAQFLVSQVCFFARQTAPDGFLKCNGAAVSRTAYADLFDAIGTTYGVGNGSSTFNLPDMRGEFIRGWDDGRAVDSGRVFGSAQDEAFKSHGHSGSTDTVGSHTHSQVGTNTLTGSGLSSGSGVAGGGSSNTGSGGSHSHSLSISSSGGTETRPRNMALLACIKY